MSFSQLWQEVQARAKPTYQRLNTGEGDGPYQPTAQWRQYLPRGRRAVFAICGVLFVLATGVVLRSPPHIDVGSLKAIRHAIEPSAGRLHLLIPTGNANSRFCRTSLASTILGYPYPFAIDWGGKHNDDAFRDAAWEYGKFIHTFDYLKEFDENQGDDLVLLADGEDSWFQLKPEVLIQRYKDITKNAEKRLEKSIGGKRPGVRRPDIVFAAQKTCHAQKKEHIGCYAAPPPPEYLSMRTSESTEPYLSDNRPRFLASAMMMGTVSSLRALHQLGYERWQSNPSLYNSRDDLFASIFGEQEYQREQLRSSALTWFQWLRAPKTFLTDEHPPPQAIMYAKNLTSADMGITLDYTSSLAHIADGTGDWVRFSDPATLFTAASTANLTGRPPIVKIARDIEYSRPPFWSLAPYSSSYPFEYEDLPKKTPWEDMPLYTNLATSITPAIILFNHDAKGEEFLNGLWKRMWFHPYTRKKLLNVAYEPTIPIATTLQENIPQRLLSLTQKLYAKSTHGHQGRPLGEKQWWTSVDVSPICKEREGHGFIINLGNDKRENWKKWADECDDQVQADIIGDDEGKWQDPKVYPPYPDLEKDQF